MLPPVKRVRMSGLKITLIIFTSSPLGERVGVRGKNASMIYPISFTPTLTLPRKGGGDFFDSNAKF